jgi:hypothetical protein
MTGVASIPTTSLSARHISTSIKVSRYFHCFCDILEDERVTGVVWDSGGSSRLRVDLRRPFVPPPAAFDAGSKSSLSSSFESVTTL